MSDLVAGLGRGVRLIGRIIIELFQQVEMECSDQGYEKNSESPCNRQELSRATDREFSTNERTNVCVSVVNTVADQYTAPSSSLSDTIHIYLPASISSSHHPDYIALNQAPVYSRL